MNIDTLYEQSTDPQELAKSLVGARTRTGMTQQAVAEALDITRQVVIAWEAGKRLPPLLDLAKLAELYGRSVHELRTRRPEPQPLALQLRAARRLDEALEQELERKREDFQALCDDYLALERLRASPLPAVRAPIYPLTGDRPERLAEDAAAAERNRLGLGDAPILNLRETLEHEGLRIFLIDLPSRIAGFYGATSELGPCMAINRKHPADRQRWTMVHEHAHFLTDRFLGEVAEFYTYREVPEHERFADAFARNFLLPATSVSRRYHEMARSRGKFVPADLCLIAHYFFVSIEAMALRLEEIDLAPPGHYQTLVAHGFRPAEARARLQIEPHVISEQPLPLRYQYLATEALVHGDISEDEYAAYLRTEPVMARRLAQALRTSVVQASSGEVETIELPLDREQGA